jgi:hypothetical protein
MTVQAHVGAIDCDFFDQIKVLVQQFGGDKKGWSAGIFDRNFMDAL